MLPHVALPVAIYYWWTRQFWVRKNIGPRRWNIADIETSGLGIIRQLTCKQESWAVFTSMSNPQWWSCDSLSRRSIQKWKQLWNKTITKGVQRAAVPASRGRKDNFGRKKEDILLLQLPAMPTAAFRAQGWLVILALFLWPRSPVCPWWTASSCSLPRVKEHREVICSTVILPVLLLTSPHPCLTSASFPLPFSAANRVVLGKRGGKSTPGLYSHQKLLYRSICFC